MFDELREMPGPVDHQVNKFVDENKDKVTQLNRISHKIEGKVSLPQKMSDNAVLADIVSILTEKPEIVTLDICTCVLPLLTSLLESEIDQHLGVSLEMLLKLVKVFGSFVYSSLSVASSVGVDIEAEQVLIKQAKVAFDAKREELIQFLAHSSNNVQKPIRLNQASLKLGTYLSVHGLPGEVRVNPSTGFPELRFSTLSDLK